MTTTKQQAKLIIGALFNLDIEEYFDDCDEIIQTLAKEHGMTDQEIIRIRAEFE